MNIQTAEQKTDLTIQNSNGQSLYLVIPGQPLVVYLSQKAGVDYNTDDWLEK